MIVPVIVVMIVSTVVIVIIMVVVMTFAVIVLIVVVVVFFHQEGQLGGDEDILEWQFVSLGDLDAVALKEPAGGGVGDHHRGDFGT